MMSLARCIATLCLISLGLTACTSADDSADPRIEVLAEDLLNPIGLAILPDGTLLVAEEGTGEDDESAGVSLIADGRAERVVTGLPSSRDSGDLSGVPMVGVSPDGRTVYTAHFGLGSLLTLPAPSLAQIDSGAVLQPDDLGRAMLPLNRVELVNPFDVAFSPDGTPVVTDASGNGVATETADGRTEFIHRFGQLRDPANDALRIDPVPTGITRVDDEYLVTLTGGCPYPDGAGRLVAIDGDQGERLVVDGLTMPIDVTVDQDGTIWVLEFARFDPDASCFSGAGYMPRTGRLSKLEGDRLVTVVDELDYPGAVVAGPDGALYVSEVFAGRVVRITLGEARPQASEPSPPANPWRFTDVAAATGLDFRHGAFRTSLSEDPVAMMGGGLCWIDIEGDGDLDLYLVNSHAAAEADWWQERGGLPTNALYENEGDTFIDITATSGTGLAMRGNGCVVADFDADGDADIYVTAAGPNAYLVNDGMGRFADMAEPAGVVAPEWSTAAVAGDINRDGHLDLFVGSYIDLTKKIAKPSGAFPQDYIGIGNHLYLGDGAGSFTDVAATTPAYRDDRTLGALLSDLDQDGDLDLYVANDGQPNNLYENLTAPGGELRMEDVTRTADIGDSGSGMGVAGGDYDGDGATDLMITNWEAELHAVYRNSGSTGLTFDYSTHRIGHVGLGNGETGWGTSWADFDHDTDVDLLIANGRVPVTNLDTDPELVRLFGNLAAEGSPGQLRDWTVRTGLAEVGPQLARGAAVADFDDDGDLDVAINQIAGPVVLLRNDTPNRGWLEVALQPPVPGTRVDITLTDGSVLTRELYAGSSYLSSGDPRLHFGLGDGAALSIRAWWPDGATATQVGSFNRQVVVVGRP